MKKKKISGLSLNKNTISKLNNPGAIKGGCETMIVCPFTENTCIGGPDPYCGLGSDACFSDNCVTAGFQCNER